MDVARVQRVQRDEAVDAAARTEIAVQLGVMERTREIRLSGFQLFFRDVDLDRRSARRTSEFLVGFADAETYELYFTSS